MPDWWEEGYDEDAADTLDADGSYVEPDARHAIKKYLKAMGLTGYKKKFKKSELREAIRAALAEAFGGDRYVRAGGCRRRDDDVEVAAEDGESAIVGVDEQASTMGRMNFMSTSDEEEDDDKEVLPEFADWAQGFQDAYDDKRYTIMARQIYDDWPDHEPEVDWGKVLDTFVRNRRKNLHTEIDIDKLYEKLLSYVEDHYDGNVPPTAVATHGSDYGAGYK